MSTMRIVPALNEIEQRHTGLCMGAEPVVEAIGAGRLAARSIHLNYQDEDVMSSAASRG